MNYNATIRLDLSGLKRLQEGLRGTSSNRVKVGVLAGKTSRSGNSGGETNATIGFDMEFGAVKKAPFWWHHSSDIHIPARSFLRVPLEKHLGAKLKQNALKVFSRLVQGHGIWYALSEVGKLGTEVVDEAFESSGDSEWVSNHPTTIENKGHGMPLIDSGQLRKSISYQVI